MQSRCNLNIFVLIFKNQVLDVGEKFQELVIPVILDVFRLCIVQKLKVIGIFLFELFKHQFEFYILLLYEISGDEASVLVKNIRIGL
jgi:hypothetical protein